jgi:hypothetical protein
MQRAEHWGAWLGTTAVALLLPVMAAAYSAGIDSTQFGPSGCNSCHATGDAPTVMLSGPTTVAPGGTAEYTLQIFSDASQHYGGLNARASAGELSTGGMSSGSTRTIVGAGGFTEITHNSPKAGNASDVITFSFQWTAAPDFSSSATLTVWGNAVNNNHSPVGDAAAMTTLTIISSTPDACGSRTPLSPPLVTDAAAQACQKAVAKAGGLYVKKTLQAVQKCLKTWQAGSAPADPIALCAGSAAAVIAPTDAKTAATFAKAESKLRGQIAAKCSDAQVAALDACSTTESGLENCLLATHRQAVATAVTNQYGSPPQSGDKSLLKCQATVAKVSAALLTSYIKASQKCLDTRNADGTPADGAAACIGAVSFGEQVPPTDAKVAAAIAKRASSLVDKINGACSDAQTAALDACGDTQADLDACLQCAHRNLVFDLLADQYGGN